MRRNICRMNYLGIHDGARRKNQNVDDVVREEEDTRVCLAFGAS